MYLITKKIALCAIACAALLGCTKDVEYKGKVPSGTDLRVVVGNEGNFTRGNASLTTITYDGTLTNDVFRMVNDRPIGDVIQSIAEIGDNLYVTLNNSRKIEVLNKTTFVSVKTMPTFEATIPTYIVDLGADSIAVGEKGGKGRLMIMNVNQPSATEEMIFTGRTVDGVGATNQMKVTNGKLFLAGSKLRVFDLNNIFASKMRTIKGLAVGEAAATDVSVADDSKIVQDKNGKLWVLSKNKLVCIDPATETVVQEFPFVGVTLQMFAGRLDISADGERLYFSGIVGGKKGVLRMSITDKTAPTELLFAHPDVQMQYNVAVSPEETIFICDALDYTQRGLVREYTTAGEILKTYEAGIIPSYIHFMRR